MSVAFLQELILTNFTYRSRSEESVRTPIPSRFATGGLVLCSYSAGTFFLEQMGFGVLNSKKTGEFKFQVVPLHPKQFFVSGVFFFKNWASGEKANC